MKTSNRGRYIPLKKYTLDKELIIEDYTSIINYSYQIRVAPSHIYAVLKGKYNILGKEENFQKYNKKYMKEVYDEKK